MVVKYAATPVVALTAIQIFVTTFKLILLMAPTDALRMINLDVPQMAIQGDTIQLSCSYMLVADGDGRQHAAAVTRYDLDESGAGVEKGGGGGGDRSTGRMSAVIDDRLSAGRPPADEPSYRLAAPDARRAELLYAIKWYKDEREFFRYVSQDWPHKQVLPMDGLSVDVEKSDNQTVVLRNVSLRASGLFRCEVSTDAPSFLTKSIERKVLIYSLPTEGPTIEPSSRVARQIQYLGDQLEFTCLSRESKPPVQLDWILNEQINLTSAIPQRNSQGDPVFQVASKRLVRLPNASIPEQVVNNHISDGLGYTTLALESAAETGAKVVSAKHAAASNSHAQQTETINEDNLDQLAEITMSKLKFTVDSDLMRLISEISSGGEQARRAADSKWRTRKANQHAAGTTRKSSLTSESVRERHKVSLRIRCVARVLHFKMSDDVKLTIANKTRAHALSREHTTASSHRRNHEEANSAHGLESYNLKCWLIVLVMFVLVAPRDLRMVWNVY